MMMIMIAIRKDKVWFLNLMIAFFCILVHYLDRYFMHNFNYALHLLVNNHNVINFVHAVYWAEQTGKEKK